MTLPSQSAPVISVVFVVAGALSESGYIFSLDELWRPSVPFIRGANIALFGILDQLPLLFVRVLLHVVIVQETQTPRNTELAFFVA